MPKIGRRRVTQGLINQMGELRRQGLPFHEIARKLGCSERMAGRYSGHIRSSLELPPAVLEASPEDPHLLREELARWFADTLYQLEAHPRPRQSVTFLNEAMLSLRERLDVVYWPQQWEVDEMVPIAEAFDRLFRKLGLL